MTDVLAPHEAARIPRRWLLLEILVWTLVGAAAVVDEVLLAMTLGDFWADRIGQLLS
jgi:hypothetical protein